MDDPSGRPTTDQAPESEPSRAGTILMILLGVLSFAGVFGAGWGLMALFGYYWVLVDLAAAPGWSVTAAFVAMPFLMLILGFAVGDGSVIEVGLKIVITGTAIWVGWGKYIWLDPILLAAVCGLAVLLAGFLAGRFVDKVRAGGSGQPSNGPGGPRT